jgi:hypothetical protein
LTLSSLGGGPEAVKLLPWFTAYETSGRMEPLMAWWERNAKEISRMRVERAPPPAAVLRAVLEFKFLSRNIVSKLSMAGIRVSRLLLSLREDRPDASPPPLWATAFTQASRFRLAYD